LRFAPALANPMRPIRKASVRCSAGRSERSTTTLSPVSGSAPRLMRDRRVGAVHYVSKAIHRPAKLKAARSPEAQLCATHIGSRNIETAVSFRRVVDTGRAPVALHAPMDLLPCRLLRRVLSPMRDGSLSHHSSKRRMIGRCAPDTMKASLQVHRSKASGSRRYCAPRADADPEVAPGVSRLQRRPECREERTPGDIATTSRADALSTQTACASPQWQRP